MMRHRKFLRKLLLFLLTLPVFIFIFFPILWLLSASLSTQVELFTVPPHWIPQHPTLQNYMDIIFPNLAASSVPRTFAIALLNSIKIASTVTVICLVIGSLAAYALVRIPFRLNRSIHLGIIGTRMIPEVSLVLPLFIIASSLQLINKPVVLIIAYMSFALPYAIWLMAAYFQTVPIELEEAARLDGCTRLGILFRVVMPISVPGLVSTAMFIFLLAWDEFFYALIFTSTLAAKTAPVAIAEFVGRYVVNITGMMAGGVVVAIPPVLLALIFQRYIVSGLTAGAVKG
jgi:multiple sugar transport system permease protein